MISKDKIRDLLGSGLSSEIVATVVGCDPSYVSQLLSDQDFAHEVSTLRSSALMADSRRDKSIGAIEDKLVDKLDAAVDRMYKPQDLLRAFAVINAAKRRGTPAHASTVVQNTVVNLQLPTSVIQKFVTNRGGEVVEVDDQTLVTMPASVLLKRLSASRSAVVVEDMLNKAAAPGDKYARANNFIPPARE